MNLLLHQTSLTSKQDLRSKPEIHVPEEFKGEDAEVPEEILIDGAILDISQDLEDELIDVSNA